MLAMPFDARASSFSLANAQLLGQAAAVAYDNADACRAWASLTGLNPETLDFFDQGHTQGFVVQGETAIVVAFRGTEPTVPMDWLSDLAASHETWGHPVGTVHKGFYEALRVVWGVTLGQSQVLPRRLRERGERKVWVTGHSLGGALAELCAAQAFFVEHVPIQGVYTFGQPRVGDDAFARALNAALGSRIFRMVNDKDIVPRVPLFSMGYRHYGNEVFFDHDEQRHDHPTTVENLASALRFAALAFNFDPVARAGQLLVDAVKAAGLFGRPDEMLAQLAEVQERAALGDINAVLRGGAEKIADHDMSRYLTRLGTSKPAG
jgi:triacylglycerol lipase